MSEPLIQASQRIVGVIGYIRSFQERGVEVTNKQLNHIIKQLQEANSHIGHAVNEENAQETRGNE